MAGEVRVGSVPDERDQTDGTPARQGPDPQELARMAQRLREVDELSQFLVAMRDAVQAPRKRA